MATAPLGEGEYFDHLVGEQGDFNPFTARGWRTLARRFEKASGGDRGLCLLDIGCGTGNSRQVYAPQTRRYVGVDLSKAALQTASRRHADAGWIQADGTRLPFGDRTFDAVAFSSVLHHLPDVPSALAEARRVLTPGGFVFAFDPNLLHPAMLLFRYPRSPFYRADGVSPHEQPLLPRALAQQFIDAGFGDVGQRCQSDIPYRHVAPRLLNALLPAYNLADRLWEYSGAGRWLGTFVVTWGRTPRT